jgi:hypothetical protein
MGPHKASKSPPSISRLRRKEKVRGLYALPLELFKSSLPLKAKNHLYSGEHGGCVLSIKKGLTFYNINTLNFARVFTSSHYRFLVKKYLPLFFRGIKHHLINLRRILKIARGNMTRQKTIKYPKLINNSKLNKPKLNARTRLTKWVSGKIKAKYCAHRGKPVSGKKVPLKRNMGVINKNMGRLNNSILSTMPVKNIAVEPKAIPPRNAAKTINIPAG